jgi:hypothetical protein
MIFLITPFALLIILILWIVFVPVYLKINTNLDRYYVGQYGTVSISFHPGADSPLRLSIFGLDVKSTKGKATKKALVEKRKRRPIRKSPEAWLYLFNGVFNGFKLKRLVCAMDFDDVVLNAQLIPVALFMSRGSVHVNVNFHQEYFLDLLVQVRPNKILWTFIRFLTKK